MNQKILLTLLSLYPIFIIVWIAIAVIVFFILLKVTAPFGRHTTNTWGPMINNKLGWFIMEFTVLVVLWSIVYERYLFFSLPSQIMIGLFTFHYFNRSLIFPMRLRTQKKKMPFAIMFSAITFNMVNGFMLGFYFLYYASYNNEWLFDFRFIAGLILFFSGMMVNWKADDILIHLRKKNDIGYSIPSGGLFKYVSCANLFGEVVEWTGFAILCWNIPALAFLIWTFANLIPRAISHHKWYLSNFSNYPKERKAIIPYLL